MLRCTIIACGLALAGSSPVLAGPAGAALPPIVQSHATDQLLRRGIDSWQRGDHEVAKDVFRTLAARDVAAAETLLGVMAARGLAGKSDHAIAAAWYLRAARRGYAPAQLALADAYARGRGVKADRDRAAALAKAAAVQNQPGAAQLALRMGPVQTAMLSARP